MRQVTVAGLQLAMSAFMGSMIDIPLAADLEDGFGTEPEDCAETIRQGAAAGLVGGSIEDFTGDRSNPIHSIEKAADRIRAAAEAAALHAPPGATIRLVR